jgi:hypothetical protein
VGDGSVWIAGFLRDFLAGAWFGEVFLLLAVPGGSLVVRLVLALVAVGGAVVFPGCPLLTN